MPDTPSVLTNRIMKDNEVKKPKTQKEREEECEKNGGHEYYSSAGKWQPINKMTCYHCGKIINN